MIYYQLRDSRGETHNFYGYDDSASTYCTPEPATWSKIGGQIAQVPATLTGITVYGDSSCRFAKSDMTLRCNKFAVATCVDAMSGIHYGGGGTCQVDASQGNLSVLPGCFEVFVVVVVDVIDNCISLLSL